MVSLKEGDSVQCRIKNGAIVDSSVLDYEMIQSFEIVSFDLYGYYLFVPRYIYLSTSVTTDINRCKKLDIDLRFADEQIVYIFEGMICGNSKRDGAKCARCTDFVLMAEPNQQDKKTFICFSCRSSPYR
jgi:hypothetical protein